MTRPDGQTELRSQVPRSGKTSSLVDYLCSRFRYQDAAAWQACLREGRLSINGLVAASGSTVKPGDWVAYRTVLNEPAVPTVIPILYRDAFLAVAEKPAHLPSHA